MRRISTFAIAAMLVAACGTGTPSIVSPTLAPLSQPPGSQPPVSGGGGVATTITDVCAFVSADAELMQILTDVLGRQPTLVPDSSGNMKSCFDHLYLSIIIDPRPDHAAAFFDLNATQPGSTSIPNLGDRAYWETKDGSYGVNLGVLKGAIALYVGLAVAGLDNPASVDAAERIAQAVLDGLGNR